MPKRLLIANRGEIALRIARSAGVLGVETVAVYAEDDARSLHARYADRAISLGADGVAAYLDGARIISIAKAEGCDAIHPGYGFLSENGGFAEACEATGLVFVGPTPQTLRTFGDKAHARALAEQCGAPLLRGVSRAVTLDDARQFLESLGPGGAVMLKAVAGGGGRGMRPVRSLDDLPSAFERASSEALSSFGSGEVYVEELLGRARHVEVQIVGDGAGAVSHLWDRECSLQRQRQKLVEVAPAFDLPTDLRTSMLESAVRLASAVNYRGLGTIEFLVDVRDEVPSRFAFIEANARLQVEHTVTEVVTDRDLVAVQLAIADGKRLSDLALLQDDIPTPRGVALQVRVNLESMSPNGTARPGGGVLTAYEPPTGPWVRVDGFGYAGYATSVRYDSLLAKVIVRGPDVAAAARGALRALSEFKVLGAKTNIAFLQALLKSPALQAGELHTGYVEEHAAELLQDVSERARYAEPWGREPKQAGARVDPMDPLAVLSLKPGDGTGGARPAREALADMPEGPPGTMPAPAPLQGMVISFSVAVGDLVRVGQPLAVMEALKMEHVISSPVAGLVREIALGVGDTIFEGTPLMFIEPMEVEGEYLQAAPPDPDEIRPDLAEVLRLHHLASDEGRRAARDKRHAQVKRTARENIADLCDPGSFVEYGPIVTAGRVRSDTPEVIEERILKTAADGMVMGVGQVNGAIFGPVNGRCAVLSYDYSVLAGTQGGKNHQKTDRLLGVAEKYRLPVVLYSEGGGGRTGIGSAPPAPSAAVGSVGGLSTRTWRQLGRLSGLAPLIGVNSGYCFAGNVVLLGACDVIIATKDSSLGIGGPAVIEGGGLGAYAPGEVGPVSIQEPNGVIDIVVEDEAEATAVARKYLSYFQGRTTNWVEHDQRPLRYLVPENRRAVYDIRKGINILADAGSVLELRPRWAVSMITAFIRVEGHPLGVIANNSNSPSGGAIESDGADKAARFLQLCDAFDIPVLSLIDTPGNMVGPEAEKTGLIRHCARMYVAGANLTVPYFNVVLRKAYGLGAIAMAAGSFDETFFSVSWPTGEFAGMGLEGSIKLGRRAELQAIADIPARKARYDALVAEAYAWARAVNAGTVFEVDDVIDPANTRKWLIMGLNSVPPAPVRTHKKRAWIDTW